MERVVTMFMSEDAVPTLDRRSMEELIRELGHEAAVAFAAAYRQMLPARVQRIGNALRNLDRDAAMDAALSLKTSSLMIGALRMAQICIALEAPLVLADDARAEQAGQEVERHLPQLEKSLAIF